MQTTSILLTSFFKQLLKFPTKKYYSLPHTIQSSVGLIFKFPDIQNIQSKQQFDNKILSQQLPIQNAQLLFVQRAGYHLDRNAYNVVFPGGQCDGQQNDLNACQRQLKQEIGIQAQDQCIYLGQLPSNFYYLKKRGKQVHISCHAYCLKSNQNDWEPNLNSAQLRKFKWVKVSELLKQSNYKIRNQIKLGVFERMPALAAKIAKQNITNVAMPELDLGMQRNLWGLTLWIWSYVLQMSLNKSEKLLGKQQIQNTKKLINIMKGFQLQFKPNSFYKIPATIAASGWHYLYRVKPFTYNQNRLHFSRILTTIIIVVLIGVALNYLFF